MAGVLEGAGASFDAGSHKRCHDGVHAYGEHIRHFRIPDQQQDKAFRNHNTGEHQLRNVELWSSLVSGHADHHRHHQPASGQQEGT